MKKTNAYLQEKMKKVDLLVLNIKRRNLKITENSTKDINMQMNQGSKMPMEMTSFTKIQKNLKEASKQMDLNHLDNHTDVVEIDLESNKNIDLN